MWDTKTVNLEVEGCSDAAESEDVTDETEVTEEEITEAETPTQAEEIQEEATEGVKVPVLKPETSTEIPLTKRAGFWFVLALANIIVIGSLIYVAVRFYGKKPQ